MSSNKILVIEDEPILREEISEMLSFEGFDVYSAENGRVGLQTALIHRPDLILCDIMMPEMDGVELLKTIRENEAIRLTPFIFMTALAERENVRVGMELGADDYVTKPIGRADLLKAVETRIQKQQVFVQEKEEALNILRKTVVTRLPHELRSPLSGIIGFGQLLQDMAADLSTEDVADIGKEILSSGNRLLRLIENYLIFVQLELSKPDKTTLSEDRLESIIDEAAYSTAQKHEKGDLLKITLENSCSLLISEQFLTKIIQELVDNAFRFSPSESEVSIIGSSVDESTYSLQILDKGRGFTIDQIAQIGAFMQFDRDKLEQQGAGFGLYIAKKMIELSGGEFKVVSEKEKGTTISLLIKKA
ncbi:MAG: response regulator [Bacteroidales bacterium]|nr:response regulator [Bacteroidales bacterium]